MWYYSLHNDQQEGPVDEELVHELYASGQLDDRGLVWRDGMSDWVSYADAFPDRARAVQEKRQAQAQAAPTNPPTTETSVANPYQAPQAPVQTGPGFQPVSLPGSGLATAGTIIGSISIFVGLLCCAPIGIGGGVLAIVMSQLAKGEVARAPALPDGMQVMAASVQSKIKIGLITGIVAIAASCLAFIGGIVFRLVLSGGF